MPEKKSPETLIELLQAIERSRDLRALARECGLTVRELRKRLNHWRRELKPASPAPVAGVAPGCTEEAGRKGPARRKGQPATFDPDPKDIPLDDLPRAEAITGNPLPAQGSAVLEVFTDGASRGNPGQASVGVFFRQKNGPALCVYSATIGRATNNQAEYQAVLHALELCHRWSVSRVHLYLDSELVVRQLLGVYRVKSQDLLPLYQQSMHLARQLREFRVSHLPRGRNTYADKLANQALDAAARDSRTR
jgi:ribonuclease HI